MLKALSEMIWEPRDVTALAATGATILALIVSNFWNKRTLAASRYATETGLWQKANEAELKAIQERLDVFYGPLMHMSQLNRLLARDLRGRQADSERFLLVEKLFDSQWRKDLPAGEEALVSELVANAAAIRELLSKHAVADEKLLPYLARASAHYRILELAAAGRLGSDATPWVERYVYPRQVDDVLALEVARLKRRAGAIRRNPGQPPALPEELVIPQTLELKVWAEPPRIARPELSAPLP